MTDLPSARVASGRRRHSPTGDLTAGAGRHDETMVPAQWVRPVRGYSFQWERWTKRSAPSTPRASATLAISAGVPLSLASAASTHSATRRPYFSQVLAPRPARDSWGRPVTLCRRPAIT